MIYGWERLTGRGHNGSSSFDDGKYGDTVEKVIRVNGGWGWWHVYVESTCAGLFADVWPSQTLLDISK